MNSPEAVVLVPAQAALMAKIAAIDDIPKERAAELVGEATAVAGVGGRLAAASLVKLIPGVGSVISASVASTITGAISESRRKVSECVFTGKATLDDASRVASLPKQFALSLGKPPAERVD